MDFNIKWEKQWVEVSSMTFILLGFFLAVIIHSSILSYISIVACGFLAGRVWYIKHYKEPVLPFILIISGFLIGYLLGGIWVNRLLVLILFAISFYGSYKLHMKRIITIFKSPNFIK